MDAVAALECVTELSKSVRPIVDGPVEFSTVWLISKFCPISAIFTCSWEISILLVLEASAEQS